VRVCYCSTISDERSASYCIECKQQLTEIDNRGKRLRGCMNRNIWWSLTGARRGYPKKTFARFIN
jgi:hypothetical protein